jgi:type III pantothenate kinase
VGEWPIDSIGLASVVPAVTSRVAGCLRRTYGLEPFLIRSANCGVTLKVKRPGRSGVDRILNVKGALRYSDGPAAIVDIGTAVTVDLISDNNAFLGGVILPGPELWLRSLTRTALLPGIKLPGYQVTSHRLTLASKLEIPGKDTRSAQISGVCYGLTSAIEGIIEQYRKKYNISLVFLTGGWSRTFRRFFSFRYVYKPYLPLEGVNLVLEEIAALRSQ